MLNAHDNITLSTYLITRKSDLKLSTPSEDSKLFNAIRLLSDIKEKHGSTKEEIAAAEKARNRNSFLCF